MSEAKLSHVRGKTKPTLLYQTIGQTLELARVRYGNRPALIVRHQDIRLTYSELAEKSERFAAGLLSLGLQPGDRVGVWAPNCYEWVVTQFATAKAGLILVNINPAYRVAELEYALNKVGCKALIAAPEFKSSDYCTMLNSLQVTTPDSKIQCLKHVIILDDTPPKGFISFAEIMAKADTESLKSLSNVEASLKPEYPINIQFTSGTTGFPKGATLTHHNIVNNGFFVAERQNFTEQDRLCIPVPLYHCFGMVMGVLGCVTHGSCMVLPAASFDPISVLEAIEGENCTALYGVPTMFIAELEHPDFKKYDLSSLRTGTMAGSPCPVEVMTKVIANMHMKDVTIAYGMTETSPVSLQSQPTDPLEMRVSTVGEIHPHVEVKIVDEDGRTLARGTQGELCTKGYSVMIGYWGDKEKTLEAIDADGWMHTGDLAIMDAKGYVNITGRVKDMIIRGGENIYPREIEEYLYRHSAVQDVQVFGVPDEKYGEVVCAWVMVKSSHTLDEETLRDFCSGQISHYKIPKYIKFVSEYPMTVTGKIQKFEMREAMAKELGVLESKTA